MTVALLGVIAVIMIGAGPVMILQGYRGRRAVAGELAAQRITFPERKPGDPYAAFTGRPVTTGGAARRFADMIGANVTAALGGRTYAEVSAAALADTSDARLAELRETAFMGQTLRGTLYGAYQAWQVTLLVIALGGLTTLLGLALALVAARLA
ncbi:hypothetical protein [Catenuloplanes japonicus]|uniref:hypothetical protein n=1 Tax=Catenuloplanes japonicus TaxID=33876 RepID=UPI0012F95A39|nr:hypothetical protein [Catenuloplanes japonicus]